MSASAAANILRKPSVRSLYDKQEIWAVPKACRKSKDVMIGYEAQSTGRLITHPLQYL
jgi:hypothetical protein